LIDSGFAKIVQKAKKAQTHSFSSKKRGNGIQNQINNIQYHEMQFRIDSSDSLYGDVRPNYDLHNPEMIKKNSETALKSRNQKSCD